MGEVRPTRLRLYALAALAFATGIVMLAYALSASGASAALRERWDVMTWSPVSRGASVYQANCSACHGGSVGGTMSDHPPKLNANGHAWHHADCELIEVVRRGMTPSVAASRPQPPASTALAMPAWAARLSDEDIRAVVAYVRTTWSDDQRAQQERATRERCS